jgi:hypothetical protein
MIAYETPETIQDFRIPLGLLQAALSHFILLYITSSVNVPIVFCVDVFYVTSM